MKKTHAFTIRRKPELGIEIIQAYSDRRFTPHYHDQFGIGLMLSGAQRSASGRGQVEAIAGDLISVNPGEVHDGIPLESKARHWYMLYFEPEVMLEALADLSLDQPSCVYELIHPVLSQVQAATAFRTLCQSLSHQAEPDAHWFRDQALPLLLMYLSGSSVRRPAAINPGVVHVKNLIDEAAHTALSLADLAHEAGLSRFQLLRAFTRLTGLTPYAYLLQRRIQIAKKLISSNVSLAQAAFSSGFADQSHMTRCFVRSYGYTPGSYARQC